MSESDIQREILEALGPYNHIKIWRTNSGRAKYNIRLAPAGTPDIIGYIIWGKNAGKFLGIEVKEPGKLQKPKQIEFQCELTSAGGFYFLVHSKDEAVKLVEGLMK